ncbi:hypothetical protein M422DRAFT_154354, partial [Sphaerobolus stellatus SS14]
VKPTEVYAILNVFGPNTVSTEGPEWKRHRRITAPTFSERNNKFVWDETLRVLDDMFDAWGRNTPEIFADDVVEITKPLALLVISAASMITFNSCLQNSNFQKCSAAGHSQRYTPIFIVDIPTQNMAIAPITHETNVICTSNLVEDVCECGVCETEMLAYMREMIAERREYPELNSQADLFGILLENVDNKEAEDPLTDDEMIGDVFIYLVAGHETTAHTLCFAFALLALEQEEQERLYRNVISILPKDEIPRNHKDYTYMASLSAMYETLRMFPVVQAFMRIAAEDSTLPTVGPDGRIVTLPVPKGCWIALNLSGLHYNERHWEDPHVYRTSRFLGPDNKDAFMGFATGARACLGRKLAETETVTIISTVISKYKVDLKNPEAYEGLTYLEKREELMGNWRVGISTT